MAHEVKILPPARKEPTSLSSFQEGDILEIATGMGGSSVVILLENNPDSDMTCFDFNKNVLIYPEGETRVIKRLRVESYHFQEISD